MLWRASVSLLVAVCLATGTAATDTTAAAPTLTVTHKARSLRPGELVVLTIVSNVALSTLEVQAFGRTERVQALAPTANKPHAWIALIGIDLDVRPGTHVVSVSAVSAAGSTVKEHRLAVTPKVFATRRLTVDPDFVNPPESEAARIAEETAAIAAAWAGNAGPDPVPDVSFVAPVPHKANSAFGKRSVFNGEVRSAHTGADFLSPAGTNVKAPAAGKVVLVGDFYFPGGTVVVDHGLGVVSLFAHLSKTLVNVGDEVAQGQVLGLVGATGRVTGAHLHWAVRVNGARVDPLSLVALLRKTPLTQARRVPRP